MVKIKPGKNPSEIWFKVRKQQEQKENKKQITATRQAHDEAVVKLMELYDMQQHPLIKPEHQIILEKARVMAIVRKQRLTKPLIKSVNEIYNKIHPK